jgi:hypothetical protein
LSLLIINRLAELLDNRLMLSLRFDELICGLLPIAFRLSEQPF